MSGLAGRRAGGQRGGSLRHRLLELLPKKSQSVEEDALHITKWSKMILRGWAAFTHELSKGTADEVKFLVEFISSLVCHSSSQAGTEPFNRRVLHVE